MSYLGDLHSLTTFDGNVFYFPDASRAWTAYSGYGAPNIEYQTRRGYRQDGSTQEGYTISERVISVRWWERAACSRQEYWNLRAALHDFLRPNRGGPLTLVLIQPDGTKRALRVRANPGMTFSADQNNMWNVDEGVEFIAFDPIWYNPVVQTLSPIASQDDIGQLVFPITFPIVFGGGSRFYTQSITYTGSWRADLIMTILGPYDFAVLENATTGVSLKLQIPIIAGQQRIVRLLDDMQTVIDENGGSALGELSADSNLVDFTLQPDPIAANGINVLRANIGNGIGYANFQIEYYQRFFAL